MKLVWKKAFLCMSILSLTLLSGCNNNTDESKNTKQDAKTEEKKVKLVENDLYVEPLNPTQAQIEAYNLLSDAVEKQDHKKEAEMVAVSFAYDFFTLSNKKDSEDLGGLQFIPTDKIRNFMEFARSYYYGNYPTIVNEYGKDSLPEVSGYTIDSVTESEHMYNGSPCSGYDIKLSLTYKETKVERLKTSMTISVIELSDFDYDRTKDYTDTVIYDTPMKNVYRVLAVE